MIEISFEKVDGQGRREKLKDDKFGYGGTVTKASKEQNYMTLPFTHEFNDQLRNREFRFFRIF